MLSVVAKPENKDIMDLLNQEVLDQAEWDEFVARANQRPDDSLLVGYHPLGTAVEEETGQKWIASESWTHQPSAVEAVGEDYRFLRHFNLDSGNDGDGLISYTFALRTGRLDGHTHNEDIFLRQAIKEPREGLLKAVELIFGKTVEGEFTDDKDSGKDKKD